MLFRKEALRWLEVSWVFLHDHHFFMLPRRQFLWYGLVKHLRYTFICFMDIVLCLQHLGLGSWDLKWSLRVHNLQGFHWSIWNLGLGLQEELWSRNIFICVRMCSKLRGIIRFSLLLKCLSHAQIAIFGLLNFDELMAKLSIDIIYWFHLFWLLSVDISMRAYTVLIRWVSPLLKKFLGPWKGWMFLFKLISLNLSWILTHQLSVIIFFVNIIVTFKILKTFRNHKSLAIPEVACV